MLRQPPGSPEGGQFAPGSHAESDVSLTPDGSGAETTHGPSMTQIQTEPRPSLLQDCSNDRDLPTGLVRPGRALRDHGSFSSLSDFEFCPTAWAYKRLDRVEQTVGERSLTGSGVHEFLDRVTKNGEAPEVALEAVLAVPSAYASVADEVRSIGTAAVEWEATNPNRASLRDTEVDLSGEIAGFRLTGVADALEVDPDGVVVISDYKTGKPPSPVTSHHFDDDIEPGSVIYQAKVTRQPVLYAEMAEQMGHHVGRARVLFLRTNTVVEVDLDDDRGQVLRAEARNFVEYIGGKVNEAIDSGFFPARGSINKCAGCDFASGCSAAQLPEATVEIGTKAA